MRTGAQLRRRDAAVLLGLLGVLGVVLALLCAPPCDGGSGGGGADPVFRAAPVADAAPAAVQQAGEADLPGCRPSGADSGLPPVVPSGGVASAHLALPPLVAGTPAEEQAPPVVGAVGPPARGPSPPATPTHVQLSVLRV